MSWLSPSFPVGAYSFSHGIEYAVDFGLVSNRETLESWIAGILQYGAGRIDAAFFCMAYDSASIDEIFGVLELASAMRGTSELARESSTQGRAFFDTIGSTWANPRLNEWTRELERRSLALPYSIAVAMACKVFNITLEAALTAYLHSFASNLVSVGVRLIPLGQTDGQTIVANLQSVVHAEVNKTLVSVRDDFGSATLMVDWTSMQHENQYTRLFRS